MTNICDAVPVATGDPIASLPGLRSCIATLREGGSIGIFPEGQFNLSGVVGAIQDGTAYLAARSGRPIVPVIIRNMRLGVKVDESNRRVECWTGFLSTVENLLNTDFQVLIGDPVLPDANGVGDPVELRQEVARITRELRQRFDELTELHIAA
jgi:1-acyl-sn-glycerol-3-phosphate acyltransferase